MFMTMMTTTFLSVLLLHLIFCTVSMFHVYHHHTSQPTYRLSRPCLLGIHWRLTLLERAAAGKSNDDMTDIKLD